MTERVTPLATAVSRRDRAVALAQALEPGLRPECPRLTIKREDEEVVAGFLAGLPSGQRVVIHPGSSRFGRFKRWPAERWGLLARHLADARQAVAIVTRGPDEDEETIRQVLEASKGAASPAPRLTLPQLVALLRRVDLFVGADSGPLHIAGLVGAPCVAVFGPKDPAVYAPAGARVVRREDLPCSPCVRRSCRRLDCLLGLDVNAVAEAAIQELDRRPPISR
jgi:ADP-heptose:LPS heptosyltransferase